MVSEDAVPTRARATITGRYSGAHAKASDLLSHRSEGE